KAMSKIPFGASQGEADFYMKVHFNRYLKQAPPDNQNQYRDEVSFFNAWESGEVNYFPTYLDVYSFMERVNTVNKKDGVGLNVIEIPKIVNSSGTMYPLLIRAENPLIEDDKGRGYREDSYYNRIIK